MIFFHGGAVGGGGKRSGLGKDFSGLLAYLYEGDLEVGLEEGFERGKAREERVEWISSRNIPRCADLSDWRSASRHFTTVHGRTQQPVYHVGIALEPGVSLSREQWEKSVDRLLSGLGLEDHRVLVVAHKDSAHEHVHLVVHRVNVLTDRIWQPSFDGKKAAVVLRELERELGLRELGIEAKPALQLTSGEHQVAKSAELPPLASRARAEVLVDFQESGSWGELVGRLGAKGYGLEPAARGGGVVLVGSEGLRVSISRLDGDLSGPKLARRYGETLGAHLEGRSEGVEVSRAERAFVVPETGRLADELGSRYATWTRGDAMRELSGQAGRDELVAALVASPHVVKLPSQPGRAERFASVSYLAQELSVLDAARSLSASKDHPRGHRVEVIDGPTAQKRAEGVAAEAEARRQDLEGRLSAKLEQAKGELEAARESLSKAVGRVYASPDAVMAHLTRWSQSDGGAGMGNLEKISPLRGRERALLGPDAERQEALSRLPEVKPAYRDLVWAQHEGKDIGRLEARLAEVRQGGAGQDAFSASRANRLVDGLSSEQRVALEQVAGGGGLGLVVGRAGSGKTELAAAIGAVHEEAGYRVFGAALAAKAAQGLEEASGIPSSTVASLVARIDAGKVSLGRKTLLVVDEAGILDTSQLAGLLDRAAAAGSKVVLMGDPDQLQPIGAGAPFRGLLAEHAYVELGEIRRQRDPEQAALVGGLARARVEDALVAHDAAGRLLWHGHVSGAREAMADRWISAGEQERPLLVAYRRQDVAELNRLVQERRIAAGELGGRVGEGELRIGDQVVFGRNGVVEFGERVQNGVVGRLVGTSGPDLRISIEGRGEVQVDPRLYRGLELGYALSLHRSQGQTSERVEVLADALMDRHGAYVALSRHREEVRLHVPVSLGASSAADGQLLEGVAVEGRLRVAVGRGLDVGSLSGADRASFGRGLVEVDRGSLVSGLAERMSVSRSKGLAKDYGGELDYGGIVKAREDVLEAIATARAEIRGAALRERQAAYFAEALPAARAAVEVARGELVAVVGKVFANPDRVMRDLSRQAHDRWTLSERDVSNLGELRGKERRLLGPDQARLEAVSLVPRVSRAFARLSEAHRELRGLEGRFKGFEAREGPVAAPGVGGAVAGLAAGVSAARSAASLGKSLVESPDQAAASAAVVAANAVSPAAGRVAGVAAGVSQANSPESAFVTATLGLGKMALSQSVVMLPPGLRSVATVGLGVLGKVIDVAGPER